MSFTHRTIRNKVHIGLGTVGCTLDEFRSFFPDYKLDTKFVDREYVPGYKHVAKDEDWNITSLTMPWPEGDRYLSLAGDVGAAVDGRRHGENWKKEIDGLPPAERETRMKLQDKLQAAKEAEERLKQP